jgi:hypothetical protein
VGVDKAGWRATRVAKIGVEIALALTILMAVLVAVGFFGNVFRLGGLGSPGLVMMIPIVLLLIGLYWLREFLRDVTAGMVFTLQNAQRLSRIGWLLVAVAVLRSALPFLLGGIMAFSSPMMIVPILFAIFANGLLIAGLLLLVIAAAWRYGIDLQNERDLTV